MSRFACYWTPANGEWHYPDEGNPQPTEYAIPDPTAEVETNTERSYDYLRSLRGKHVLDLPTQFGRTNGFDGGVPEATSDGTLTGNWLDGHFPFGAFYSFVRWEGDQESGEMVACDDSDDGAFAIPQPEQGGGLLTNEQETIRAEKAETYLESLQGKHVCDLSPDFDPEDICHAGYLAVDNGGRLLGYLCPYESLDTVKEDYGFARWEGDKETGQLVACSSEDEGLLVIDPSSDLIETAIEKGWEWADPWADAE